ncbi:nicotinate-nucleotide--dimethylbenzimidazole phosphoribosyltransferase [Gordonia pseudamarae]|uniref:Nicotinate-nucleotide--dimethylbenzimidazole phosphoribosyltransferase n=1 Tax=Gordonia pseudamarae TaxID=2831662 RepID=A0ABX6IK41_9ACTN|nr:nicotinate-nucleotide--dimethylbenzimidazole phosphoribosyltransferase [Gordonia pseudamarae]QHN35729.1 nicotinate-nucleotide--dimethylbenzimidazole phosphoribosyltransferase [Gordonia pseudamarae]
MTGTRTLILGGVRSGKSAHGEALLAAHPRVRYLATGPTTSSDTEWVARVRAHRERRGERYRTVETSDVARALADDPATPTLVDDLGNWVAAQVDSVSGWDDPARDIEDAAAAFAAAVAAFTGDLVLISPEVGLAPVPMTPAGRRFQDDLGALNARIARVCDRVLLVVAGRVLELPGATVDGALPAADAADIVHAAPVPVPAIPVPTVPVPTVPVPAIPVPTVPVPTVPVPAIPVPAVPVPTVTLPVDGGPTVTAGPARTDNADRHPDQGPDHQRYGAERTGALPVPARPVDPADAEIFPPIDAPDHDAAEAARARQLTLTKPPRSLGRLEDLGTWIAACQGMCPPHPLRAPRVVVFAGDHGVARDGVSAYPPEVTAQMVANICDGGAAINVLARRAGATVHVADISVDADTDPAISAFKVRRSSDDLRITDTLSLDEARRALAAGRAIADSLVDSGADLLIAGEMGIGNTTPAAILVGTIASREPVEVVGRGSGIDDAGWIRKTAAIRDGMRRVRRHRHDPLAMLAAVAGADLTAMAGFLAQAAVRKTPVIVDGVIVTATALVAEQLAPGAAQWWVAGHRSAEPAHSLALEHLDLDPILEMSMRLGEGTGAMLALPVVQSAIDVLTSMATFGEAGVSGG